LELRKQLQHWLALERFLELAYACIDGLLLGFEVVPQFIDTLPFNADLPARFVVIEQTGRAGGAARQREQRKEGWPEVAHRPADLPALCAVSRHPCYLTSLWCRRCRRGGFPNTPPRRGLAPAAFPRRSSPFLSAPPVPRATTSSASRYRPGAAQEPGCTRGC